MANTGVAVTTKGRFAMEGVLDTLGGGPAFGSCAGPLNVTLRGGFVATVTIQRSFDAGVTWSTLTVNGAAFPSLTAPASEVVGEGEDGVLYRLFVASYTSGSVSWRISQ